jgi:hypothetical protein
MLRPPGPSVPLSVAILGPTPSQVNAARPPDASPRALAAASGPAKREGRGGTGIAGRTD